MENNTNTQEVQEPQTTQTIDRHPNVNNTAEKAKEISLVDAALIPNRIYVSKTTPNKDGDYYITFKKKMSGNYYRFFKVKSNTFNL